ncbi:hypothetical protein BC834DRAFT_335707 [Gloeopeniophorella convolvens]|nr:hypothetical protein BC834DRAFT_335707 [Gloeopeniophorella convolvens]
MSLPKARSAPPSPILGGGRRIEEDPRWVESTKAEIKRSFHDAVDSAISLRDIIFEALPPDGIRRRTEKHFQRIMSKLTALAREELDRRADRVNLKRRIATGMGTSGPGDSRHGQPIAPRIYDAEREYWQEPAPGRHPYGYKGGEWVESSPPLAPAGTTPYATPGSSPQSPSLLSPFWTAQQANLGRKPEPGPAATSHHQRSKSADNPKADADAALHPTRPPARTPGGSDPDWVNITARGRLPASADPPSYPPVAPRLATSLSPNRAVPSAQRSPKDVPQEIRAAQRAPANYGARGYQTNRTNWPAESNANWARYDEDTPARLSPIHFDLFDDLDDVYGEPRDGRSPYSTPRTRGANLERSPVDRESERRRDEAERREEEAIKKEAELRRLEEQVHQILEEAIRMQEESKRKQEEIERKEAELMEMAANLDTEQRLGAREVRRAGLKAEEAARETLAAAGKLATPYSRTVPLPLTRQQPVSGERGQRQDQRAGGVYWYPAGDQVR